LPDREPDQFPFWVTVFEPPPENAARAQDRHRLKTENALRTSAIGDNLPIIRQLGKASLVRWVTPVVVGVTVFT
jgi:hypothetical protein